MKVRRIFFSLVARSSPPKYRTPPNRSTELPATEAEHTEVRPAPGRQTARRRIGGCPVHGAEKVARFLVAITNEDQTGRFLESVGSVPSGEVHIYQAQVNGGPGVVLTSGDEPISALVLDVSEGRVRTICLVANPEKLAGVRALGSP